jgi:hypothetical protein
MVLWKANSGSKIARYALAGAPLDREGRGISGITVCLRIENFTVKVHDFHGSVDQNAA